MNAKKDLEQKVMMAARDNGVSSVLFRNAIGRKMGLSLTDSECLSFLTLNPVATPTQLSRYTSLTTGATTAMLDRLEKADLIKRLPNPNDRRGVLVQISKRYSEIAAPLVAGVQEAHRELLASYSEQELVVIKDFLTRFAHNVSDQTAIIEQSTPKK